jgi:hypothetical protein
MTYIIAVAIGALLALGCLYAGFWLGRIPPESTPSFDNPLTDYEGAVLDYAVYPDQTADE